MKTAANIIAANIIAEARTMDCGYRVTLPEAADVAAALLRHDDADGGQIDEGRWDISGDGWRVDLRRGVAE